MTIWFYSDPHYGQDCSEWDKGRTFASVEEQDETMIERHNALVKPSDHVYCLGDFAMAKKDVERVVPRLNGHKRLIMGNHDIYTTDFYRKCGFQRVMAVRKFDHVPIWFSHFPIAPWCFGRQDANVHGHSHAKKPLRYTVINAEDKPGFVLPKVYINISVENTNYQPVSLEAIQALVK